MSHSHLAIRHLIRELQSRNTESKHMPPEWLLQKVHHIAEMFEPFSGVARVGFECAREDNAWELGLFLGECEIVGGPQDGQLQAINFRFDVISLQAEFDRIEAIQWNVFPNDHVFESSTDLSFIMIVGEIAGETIRLKLHAAPPEMVDPALKQHSDGRVEVV